jgi:hypothetical protein
MDEELHPLARRGAGDARADIAVWRTAQEKADSKTPLIIVECKAENITITVGDYYQGEAYRVSARDVLGWIAAGQPVTVLDDRSSAAYEGSRERIRGDVHVDHDDFRIDPSWPRDRITVVY